jgi:hypothetical protein
MNRAVRQRMFVVQQVNLEHQRSAGQPDEMYTCYPSTQRAAQVRFDHRSLYRYDITGSTGLLYHVRLTTSNQWQCTCPDWLRRRIECKHVFYVLLRVLRCDRSSLLSPAILNFKTICAQVASTQFASTNIKQLLSLSLQEVKERRATSTECCICIEPLGDDNSKLVHCETTCGNALHRDCHVMMNRSQKKDICPYCREPMFAQEHPNTSAVALGQSYVSLAAQPVRNHSRFSLQAAVADIFGQ